MLFRSYVALQNTLGGRIALALKPATDLAGFPWQANVALIGAFAAKEAGIVVTFEARDREHGQTVLTALREAGFTPEIV